MNGMSVVTVALLLTTMADAVSNPAGVMPLVCAGLAWSAALVLVVLPISNHTDVTKPVQPDPPALACRHGLDVALRSMTY